MLKEEFATFAEKYMDPIIEWHIAGQRIPMTQMNQIPI